MPHRSPLPALTDIVDAIDRIRSAISGITAEDFGADWKVQWIVQRGIEIVSEASRRLPDDFKAAHPQIPWRKVAGIGNILRHDYSEIAPSVIWNVATRELDELLEVCRAEAARIERMTERSG